MRVRKSLLSVVPIAIISIGHPVASETLQPLSIADGIESTRAASDADGMVVFESPDKSRYVSLLIRGNLDNNVVEAELVSGELTSVERARPASVAKLSTSGLGADSANRSDFAWLTWPGANVPVWIDSERVALLWADNLGVRQVLSIDTITGKTEFLSHSATDVLSFAVGLNEAVLYRARVAAAMEKSQALVKSGFAVTSLHAAPLLAGYADGTNFYDLRWNNEIFIAHPSRKADRKVQTPKGSVDSFWYRAAPVFSHDGRLAIISRSPDSWSPEWTRYKSETLQVVLNDRRRDPSGYLSRQLDQLYLLDLDTAEARPLWRVPIDYYGERTRAIAWSPDSKHVVVAPTLVPVEAASQSEVPATAAAIVNVQTGAYVVLPIDPKLAADVTKATWLFENEIQLELRDGSKFVFHYIGHWTASAATAQAPAADARVRIQLRQDINTLPALYAIDTASNRAELILDLNPTLRSQRRLAQATSFEWQTPDTRQWEGRLYYPIGYETGRRYPLVIQTHGTADKGQFSLYGLGARNGLTLGPGVAGYLAQVLASNGIAVLQVPDVHVSSTTRALEPRTYTYAYGAAIDKLVSLGIVERTKVGLYGYSGTGWHVEYAISHSDFPYAAAIVCDNIDGSYFQAALNSWETMYASDLNDDEPFGMGMKKWLENSPSFSAERIRTPLQLQVTDSGSGLGIVLSGGWELFTRLRHLRKPVELYVLAEISRGSHVPQNPQQLLALQQRTLDWWNFWLKAQDPRHPESEERYVSWRKLRELHIEDLRQPRRPAVLWKAIPDESSAENSAN